MSKLERRMRERQEASDPQPPKRAKTDVQTDSPEATLDRDALSEYFTKGIALANPDRRIHERMLKITDLVLRHSIDQIKALLRSRSITNVLMRIELDGSSRGILGKGEAGREVWHGSKWMIFDGLFEWGPSDKRGSVKLPLPTVLYPPSRLKKKGLIDAATIAAAAQDGFLPPQPLPVSEAFDVAALLYDIIDVKGLVEATPPGKIVILQPATDSGGSTLNQHLFFMNILEEKAQGRFIVWPMRCRIHQGAIVGKETAHFFLQVMKIIPKNWDKKTHLQCKTMMHKRADVSAALSAELNFRVTPVEEKPEEQETLQSLLKRMAVGEAVLKVLKDARKDADSLPCQKKSVPQVRKAIVGLSAGFAKPSWTRWLSFSRGMAKLVVLWVFWLVELSIRMWGDGRIRIKDEEVPNPYVAIRKSGHELEYLLSMLIITKILEPVEKDTAIYLRGDKVKRSERVAKFCSCFKQAEEWLRTNEIDREASLILGRALSETEQALLVRPMRHAAQLALVAMRLNWEFRMGDFRDSHEEWLSRFREGKESYASLQALDLERTKVFNFGNLALRSLRSFLNALPDGFSKEKKLRQIADRLDEEVWHNKAGETKVGDVKREARRYGQWRNMSTINCHAVRKEFFYGRRTNDVTKKEQSAAKEKAKRYLHQRGCDILRGRKMLASEKETQGEKVIASNKYANEDERKQARVLALAARQAAATQTADSGVDADEEEEAAPAPRDEYTMQQETDFYNAVEESVRAEYPSIPISDAKKGLEQRSKRWMQPLSLKPRDITVVRRYRSRVERAVCRAVRLRNKILKKKAVETDDIYLPSDDGNPDAVGVASDESDSSESEADIEEADRAEIAPCTTPAYIIRLKVRQAEEEDSRADRFADDFVFKWYVVVRVDLQDVDFSAVELLEHPGMICPTYSLTSNYFHSPQPGAIDMDDDSARLYVASIAGLPWNEVRLQCGKAIDVLYAEDKSAMEKTILANAPMSKLERRMLEAARAKSAAGVSGSLKSGSSSREGGAIRIVDAPGPKLVLPKASSSTKRPNSPSKRLPDAPAAPVKLLHETITADVAHEQQVARRAIDEDISDLQVEGFTIRDASSVDTYKRTGRFADRLMCIPDTRIADVLTDFLMSEVIDLKCQATVSLHRYASFDEGEHRKAALLLALWALRVRFVADRISKYAQDRSYRNPDPDLLQRKYLSVVQDITRKSKILEGTRLMAGKRRVMLRLDDALCRRLDPNAAVPEYVDSYRDS
ncbi:unnamed protein product [Amoebophrya sp. A25]|nr:unnamed protein product [Amoebophrya sp. A25]|eukprot:GSA25T00004409001.1